eukprot:CAMPEP_0173429042 /NCGR_PEP_ID=MMETSP1357-20121228/7861_1 /TAXON_ID=77926 /ORGANISM="Hemiselmis rufescens, Strain PCC563" /LENGTH=418 /DNA_ID=CAMNT_0014393163 /DNA_START=86 /DNA_END=1338 /DNA_ORIENTATION=-
MAMSVAIVPLSTELGYSDTIKGSVSSIFSVGYTVALLPLALAQALASPKYIMLIGVSSWSLLTLATPAAAQAGVPYLLAARAGVGAAEAVTVPTIQTFVSRWVPKQQRSRALALLYSCLQSGTILALLIAPQIVQRGDWPLVFTAFGSLGFMWAAFWVPLSQDYPDASPQSGTLGSRRIGSPNARSPASVPLKGAEGGLAQAVASAKALPWGDFFGCRGLWAATAAHAANNWGLYVSLAWLPTYFNSVYGLDLAQSSFYSLLPYAAGAITSGMAGVAADKMLCDGMDATAVRKIMQGIGSFGPLTCMAALALLSQDGGAGSPEAASALFVAAVGLGGASSAGFGASLQDISGRYSGLLYGLTSICSSITGAVGVYETGVILDTTHSWSLAFATAAASYGVGGVWYALGYSADPLFPKG